jgi:hypothetical protein
MKKIVTLISLLFSAVAHSAPPILVDPQSGKYLGNLNANPYGEFDSPYS